VNDTGLSPREEQRMLREIGVERFEDLLRAIPGSVRLDRPLGIDGPLSEIELRHRFREWSRANDASWAVSFMGGGLYDHYVPSAVDALAMRSEFATAYTPYQPEVAQGTLTAIFEFQSMIAELTGCDVANASLYDGATATVEAVLLARAQTRREKVVVAGALHPHYQAVLETYLDGKNLARVADRGGQCAPEDLKQAMHGEPACVVYQHPNFFGLLESPTAIHAIAHDAGALAIAVCDPIALALIDPPGHGTNGADIVVGEGQPLGNTPSFGGPLLGFFACKKALVRRMPGRLAAETVDAKGRRGFVLTLQTREQHIRRGKATSNICTNQGLLVTAATIYMSILGPRGLEQVANACVERTAQLVDALARVPGVRIAFDAPRFHEAVLLLDRPVGAVLEALAARGIVGGCDLTAHYPALGNALLVCATETRTDDDIAAYAAALADVLKNAVAA